MARRTTEDRTWMFVSLALALILGASATLRAAEKQGAISPFNGKDLSGWKVKDPGKPHGWVVGTAQIDPKNPRGLIAEPGGKEMVNITSGHGRSQDIYSEVTYGDAIIEVELMVPAGSNSGIYVHGEYEIQILDSWGRKKLGGGDMGAIYGARPPKINACKKPGEWQKYEIHFRAPRFDPSGKKTENARFIKIILNGKVIHEDVEMKGPTPSGVTGKEKPRGPLMFQGDHGPVAYRNIRIRPLK